MNRVIRKPIQSITEVQLGLYEMYTQLMELALDTGNSIAYKNANSLAKTILEYETGLNTDKRLKELNEKYEELVDMYKGVI